MNVLGEGLILTLLLIILLAFVLLPIIIWFVHISEYKYREQMLLDFERRKKYPIHVEDLETRMRREYDINECKDELANLNNRGESMPLVAGVIGILSGIVIGLITPFLLSLSEIWSFFFNVLGASLFFLGLGFLIAKRYKEGGLGLGLIGFSGAFAFLIQSTNISLSFFEGLFKFIVLIILVGSSVLIAIWIGNPIEFSLPEQKITPITKKEKSIITILAVITTILEFINAIYNFLKMINS